MSDFERALWIIVLVFGLLVWALGCRTPAASGPGCVRRTSRERRVLVVRPECPPCARADGGER